MPCRSDYLDPTNFERKISETAKLLLWFINKVEIRYKGTQIRIKEIGNNPYPTKEDGDFVVALLCKELHNLKAKDKAKFESIVYDRNKEARELANWWEDHEKADNIRINKDAERRDNEWVKFAKEHYVGDIEMDAHLNYFISQFSQLGYEVPKKSKEIK